MPKEIDLAGQKFGKLTVIDRAPKDGLLWTRWNCVCECGTKTQARTGHLKSGSSRSCGCANPRNHNADRVLNPKTGKMERPDGYGSWKAMQKRCYSITDPNYPNYGGRGIKMCDRWRGPGGLANFLKDMGPRPTILHSVDRKDFNGDYTPDNCRWADKRLQSNNRRGLNWLTHDGMTKTITEWTRYLGLKPGSIEFRLRRGWSIHRALSTPRTGGLLASAGKAPTDAGCANQERIFFAPGFEYCG